MADAVDWRAELRQRGHRVTPQREMILDAITELGHATPDEVYALIHERSPAVNLSTVYRTLEVLQEMGLIRHTHLSDRAPTYHAVDGHAHFHLVCRNCGRVTSVDPHVADSMLARLVAEHGFVADVGHLSVFGACQECEPS